MDDLPIEKLILDRPDIVLDAESQMSLINVNIQQISIHHRIDYRTRTLINSLIEIANELQEWQTRLIEANEI